MRRTLLLLAFLALAPRVAAAQEPDLHTVLQRAATYVDEISHRISGMVAEESYVQDVDVRAGGRIPGITHRELESDFLLVLVPGQRYVEFRDVFKVDGRPVRDRQDRLTRLFLKPSSSSSAQAASIVEESARYNIGRVTRTVNTPMLPLQFLVADVQDRFEFKRSNEARPANVKAAELTTGHFSVSTEVWVIEYREKSRGTIIRTLQGKDLPARGRFWIEPATGRVLMSELVCEDINLQATIDVSYQAAPLLGLLVPAEMRERYDATEDGTTVTGVATYGQFRQFSVHTDEDIAMPKAK
jgi:hypothetical protein